MRCTSWRLASFATAKDTRLPCAELPEGCLAACLLLFVALHALLQEKSPLAGCLALSTFISDKSEPKQEDGEGKLSTPIFQCHGDWDEMVSIQWGRQTNELLRKHFQDVKFTEMKGMGHEANQEELDLVKEFIKKRLPS